MPPAPGGGSMDVESGDLEDDSWADGLAPSAAAAAAPAAAKDVKEGPVSPQPAASDEDEKMAQTMAQMWERLEALGEKLGIPPHGDAEAFLEAAEALPLSVDERRVLKNDLWWYTASRCGARRR